MEGRFWERDLGNAEKNWYELCWEKVKKPETKQQREFVGREERKKRGFYKQCVSYQKGFPQRGRPLGRNTSDVCWLQNYKVDVEEAKKWRPGGRSSDTVCTVMES